MSESNSLIIFERAALMLAEADTIQKAKELKDLSLTAADWAKRKGMDKQVVQYARSYALEASRRMGELLQATKRAKGGQPYRKSTPNNMSVVEPTLREIGISYRESAESQFLAEVPRPKFDLVITGTKTITQLKREEKEAEREEKRKANAAKVAQVATPEEAFGLFTTILIDPPWDWGDEGDKNQMGRAKPDYAGESIEDLLKLPITTLADTHAHIYLWITNRSLPKGFGLLDAWGFRYITMLTWPKPSFGMGNYFRGQTEHVLFGIKGSLSLKRKNASTLLPTWKRSKKHSAKPLEFYGFVESCSPGPYLELYSRAERKGWVMWGEGGLLK